jgi:hypothetical protein
MDASLTIEHRKYIARETAISTVINVLLSLVFAVAVARGRTTIPLWGAQGIAVDRVWRQRREADTIFGRRTRTLTSDPSSQYHLYLS